MLSDAVKVKRASDIQGAGLVARRPIAAGELIFRIDEDKRLIRLYEIMYWPKQDRIEFLTYANQVGKDQYCFRQGDIKYVNHSCDPTAWWEGFGRLVARRDIAPGEEVTYDYSTTDIQLKYEMRCLCGSPRCRGVVTNRDFLKPEFQETYRGHLPPHVMEAIEKQSHTESHGLPAHVLKALQEAGLDDRTLREQYGEDLPEHVLARIREIISGSK